MSHDDAMTAALAKARAALEDADAEARVGGLQAVQALSLHALLPQVGERLRLDAEVAVRYQAARALAQFADPATLDALLEGLRDEDMYVRVQVTSALIRIGAAAAPGLTLALADRRAAVRRAAAMALGKIDHDDEAALQALGAALDDDDAALRRLAARSLGRLGASGAVDALGLALRDRDARVREEAAGALRLIGGERDA